jgi:hypothetical protein
MAYVAVLAVEGVDVAAITEAIWQSYFSSLSHIQVILASPKGASIGIETFAEGKLWQRTSPY